MNDEQHLPQDDAFEDDDAEAALSKAQLVERQADIAADYMEGLLDIADLDGDIEIEVRDNRPYVSIVQEEPDGTLRRLVGRNGEVLDAFQELVRLTILARTGERTKLTLDIDGHRQVRRVELEGVAAGAVAEVRRTGMPVHLDPMPSHERKMMHDMIARAGLLSESEGEGRGRHIVASPAD